MKIATTRWAFAAILFATVFPSALGQESAEHGVLLTGDALRNAMVGKYNDHGGKSIEAFCRDGRWRHVGHTVQDGTYEVKFDQFCIQQVGLREPLCSHLFAKPDGTFESHYVIYTSPPYAHLDLHDLSNLGDPSVQPC